MHKWFRSRRLNFNRHAQKRSICESLHKSFIITIVLIKIIHFNVPGPIKINGLCGHPEWQAMRWPSVPKVSGSHPAYYTLEFWRAFACASDARRVLPCNGKGVTPSQLDLPSLMPLSVAGCGRLQLLAVHWTTLVALLELVDNWSHEQWQ